MLDILCRLPLYKLFYTFGFPRILPMNYTISLTYSCNSRCLTCNVYERKAKDFNLEEYKKLFTSLGKSPYWVTFSGGEPFLKRDLAKIVMAFYDICRPKIINIPTNGILTSKIVESARLICRHCEESQIMINLSVDAIDEEHDRIRNVKGCYDKVVKTFHELKKLNIKNLSVGIHTVISKHNVENFTSIANTLMNLNPDQYITEIAEERNELRTVGTDVTPNLISYKAAADFLIHRLKHTHINKFVNKVTQAFRIEYYNLVKTILRDNKRIIPCYSGVASIQISPDGDVWSCCIKAASLGNLRKNSYDFRKIWNSKEMKRERKSIKSKVCYCPLANAAYTNMLLDFKTSRRVLARLIKGESPAIGNKASDNKVALLAKACKK